jgi:hypothetical protein
MLVSGIALPRQGFAAHPASLRAAMLVLRSVEGLNNKIRVLQRRAYGLRDQDHLRLKVLTCMLPAL